MIQTTEEFLANVEEVEKRLLPAKMSDTRENGAVIMAHLTRNFSTPQGVDASVDNIYAAVCALHYKNEIDWATPPRKILHEKATRSGMFLDLSGRQSAVTQAKIEEEQKQADKLVRECQEASKFFSGFSHAKNYAGRDALSAELTKLLAATPKPNLAQATEIRKKMRDLENRLRG